jgi:copper chaperone NosL
MLALLASACATAADASGPPEIVYGRDICLECGMLITEPRFAAAYWYEDEARRFDDIGNMLIYGIEHAELEVDSSSAWVHDYQTEVWLSADDAYYVLAPGLVTPMGWGLVAFETLPRAELLAEERGGEVLTWTQLFTFSYEQGKLTSTHDHGEPAP